MTNSQDNIEELETLQQETSELHAKRERAASRAASSEAASDKVRVAEGEKSSAPDEDEAIQPSVSESEAADRDLAVQIENVVIELEDAARERPALALLTAFMIGIVVGQLFARR